MKRPKNRKGPEDEFTTAKLRNSLYNRLIDLREKKEIISDTIERLISRKKRAKKEEKGQHENCSVESKKEPTK